MIDVRSVRTVGLNVALAIGVALSAAGCGAGGDKATADVTPDFQKKTANMLEEKSKDQMAKYKKTKGRR